MNNNLFFNERTGGTGVHYAVGCSTTTNFSANYNHYIVSDTASVGNWSSSTKNFSSWKTSSSGDANSWCSLSSTVVADSLFNDKSQADLTINPSKQAAWYSNGKGKAVNVISSVSVDYSEDAINLQLMVTAQISEQMNYLLLTPTFVHANRFYC